VATSKKSSKVLLYSSSRSVANPPQASFNLFDEDGNGELSEDEIERMLLMATRAVVRKRYNTHEDTKKATGNTAVTIPDELKGRIEEIVREIFRKIDKDGVSTSLPHSLSHNNV
jgi:Ca2+-binding EF-hand superfamily protein